MAQVTMKEIADLAGVSQPTVSRVLNNKTSMVTEETREKILKIAAELKYQPNFQAVSLKTNKSYLIGIGFKHGLPLSDPWFSTMLQQGFGLSLKGTPYELVIHNRPLERERAATLVQARRVDGFIYVVTGGGTKFRHETAPFLKENRVPFVLVHKSGNRDLDFPNVGYNNFEAGRLAARHLAGLGHAVIGLAGLARAGKPFEIQEGYKKGLAEAGLPFSDNNLLPLNMHFNPDNDGVYTFKQGGPLPDPLPTAFVCTSDYAAYNLIKILADRGISVPGDVAVVSALEQFTALNAVQLAIPQTLTTVRQDIVETGRRAASMLLDMLSGNNAGDESPHAVIEPELVIRESCGTNKNKRGTV